MSGWNKVENEIDSGPAGLAKWIVISVVFLCLVAVGFSYFSVNAERVIVENSFQYKKGREAEAAIYEANIEELDALIALNPENVDELKAQRAGINARLNAIKKTSN